LNKSLFSVFSSDISVLENMETPCPGNKRVSEEDIGEIQIISEETLIAIMSGPVV
jgi:hypothetical protein